MFENLRKQNQLLIKSQSTASARLSAYAHYTDDRHTDKHLRLVMTLIANKRTNGQHYQFYNLPASLKICGRLLQSQLQGAL